ncbi:hypothetical protein C1701_04670 [Actinoalloteichus sp. AHMU CJ021]|uniref:DUF2273 domain-containing protein n=1 Tax=Actinoalloteichus caeruleus DSM 43889 TaxID=1120930 RepID=A0ABT1JGU4_ACTCY|nr:MULTISPECIES: hypothetical protein [Actinoalloteichus]AUS77770.1 hypothetical protein C1701_04670 [Actinoalloteichus sp. AHMU CJ021]MCP2331715.1 hypothetical protein [Actinoalloteichus caeruleus DSM 43889]
MSATQTGLLAGLILGAAGAIGGFAAFLAALVVGLIGLVIGRVLDGELDLGGMFERGRGRDR